MYKNIVTFISIITIWVLIFVIWDINKNIDSNNRYQIVNTENNVVLLDKKTGLTWRNVWNNNKDKIPTNWDFMDFTNVKQAPKEYNKLFWEQFEEVKNYNLLDGFEEPKKK